MSVPGVAAFAPGRRLSELLFDGVSTEVRLCDPEDAFACSGRGRCASQEYASGGNVLLAYSWCECAAGAAGSGFLEFSGSFACASPMLATRCVAIAALLGLFWTALCISREFASELLTKPSQRGTTGGGGTLAAVIVGGGGGRVGGGAGDGAGGGAGNGNGNGGGGDAVSPLGDDAGGARRASPSPSAGCVQLLWRGLHAGKAGSELLPVQARHVLVVTRTLFVSLPVAILVPLYIALFEGASDSHLASTHLFCLSLLVDLVINVPTRASAIAVLGDVAPLTPRQQQSLHSLPFNVQAIVALLRIVEIVALQYLLAKHVSVDGIELLKRAKTGATLNLAWDAPSAKMVLVVFNVARALELAAQSRVALLHARVSNLILASLADLERRVVAAAERERIVGRANASASPAAAGPNASVPLPVVDDGKRASVWTAAAAGKQHQQHQQLQLQHQVPKVHPAPARLALPEQLNVLSPGNEISSPQQLIAPVVLMSPNSASLPPASPVRSTDAQVEILAPEHKRRLLMIATNAALDSRVAAGLAVASLALCLPGTVALQAPCTLLIWAANIVQPGSIVFSWDKSASSCFAARRKSSVVAVVQRRPSLRDSSAAVAHARRGSVTLDLLRSFNRFAIATAGHSRRDKESRDVEFEQ
jgi:hypothetical protein